MSEWQPIKTAPKNGDPIHVKLANGIETIAQWCEAPGSDIDPTGMFAGLTSGWSLQIFDIDDFLEGKNDAEITHWMPLPDPPQEPKP